MLNEIESIKTENLPFDSGVEDSKKTIEESLLLASEEIEEKDFRKSVDYVRIPELCSQGKLSCPQPLHVKNVNLDDLLALSSEDEISQQKSVIAVLENITKEGIDGTQLTEQEIIQIFLYVYGSFYSPELEFPYTLDEEEETLLKNNNPEILKAYKRGDHSWRVTIPITSLKFKDLPENFKEPITLKDKNGFEVSFRLPRFGDSIIVQQAINRAYTKEEESLFPIIKKLEKEDESGEFNTEVTLEQREKVKSYLTRKSRDYIKYILALQLVKVGKKSLSTIPEKIEAVNSIPLPLWTKFNKVTSEELNFGIIEENEVTSPITGKKVLRRLSFRPMEILQNFNKETDNEVTIHFG